MPLGLIHINAISQAKKQENKCNVHGLKLKKSAREIKDAKTSSDIQITFKTDAATDNYRNLKRMTKLEKNK